MIASEKNHCAHVFFPSLLQSFYIKAKSTYWIVSQVVVCERNEKNLTNTVKYINKQWQRFQQTTETHAEQERENERNKRESEKIHKIYMLH